MGLIHNYLCNQAMFPTLVPRAKKVLGLGLILMMPAIRTTNSNFAWQLLWKRIFPFQKGGNIDPKSHPSFGGFQPLGQGGIPHPFNPGPASGSTKKLPFTLASRRSFTNSAALSAYSWGKKKPKVGLAFCLISDPFPQKFFNNKKVPKHQTISKASFLLCIREMNETLREE